MVDVEAGGIPVAHLSSLLRATVDPVAVLDCTGSAPVLVRARRRTLDLLGLTERANGHPVSSLLPRAASTLWSHHERACVAQGRPTRVELPLPEGHLQVDFCPLSAEGRVQYIVVTVHPPPRPQGTPVDRVLSLMLEHVPVGVAFLDESLVVTRISPTLGRILNLPPAELPGHLLADLVSPGQADRIEQLARDAASDLARSASATLELAPGMGTRAAELSLVCVSKTPFEFVVTVAPALPGAGSTGAGIDEMSGLPNRAEFLQRIGRTIAAAQANAELTVLFVDIDNFKQINDALGHAVGDQVIRQIGVRLLTAAPPQALASRLGGDEFLLARVADPGMPSHDLIWAAQDAFARPVVIDGREVRVTASIGVVTSPGQATPLEALVHRADLAMYEAKRLGKDQVAHFDEELETAAAERMAIATELRGAASRDELEVFYQPIVDVITGRAIGSEALVRWRHPTKGLIPPVRFISVAEENGLIADIGQWVLEEAVRQTAAWNHAGLTRRALSVSVNLSGHQLGDSDVVRSVEAALSRWGLDPQKLTLEVTETVMMSDSGDTVARLDQLRRIGTRLAIDDFGTGYSSLSYLKRLPATSLKIDRAFIDGLGSVQEDTALVTGIIGLANALDLAVVAEGVENDRQLRELRRLGCEYSQGYFHAKPMPAHEFALWIGDHVHEPAATTSFT